MKQPPVTFVLTPADRAWWNNLRPAYVLVPSAATGPVVVFERKGQDLKSQPSQGKIDMSEWRSAQQSEGRRFTYEQLKATQRNAKAQGVRLPSVDAGLNMLYRGAVRRSLPFVFAAIAGVGCSLGVAHYISKPAPVSSATPH